jgi:hypothetical protein
MANRYFCSNGDRVTQSMIDLKYKKSRVARYAGNPVRWCHGCGKTLCNGSAHIIAQARCKTLHKTELIWDWNNFFPACNACNMAIENPKGEAWKSLLNIEECLAFIELHDPELFMKFTLNR